MTNNQTYCPDCGANISLVGSTHRCVPWAQKVIAAGMPARGTYKYRNADAWRSYMANYMRGYRQRKRETD